MIINYSDFKNLLNKRLFDGSRVSLLESIAKYPDRYIGLFRPTKPKTKLLQNIMQSQEIKFGDAFEEVFTKYFQLAGFANLPKRIMDTSNGEVLNVDQLFQNDNVIFMIEQKVRDDHDSTKKRGQFQNFENKYFEVSRNYPNITIVPIMWFVDDLLMKNNKYYLGELQRMSNDYNCSAKLCYGKELFSTNIVNGLNDNIWIETLSHLRIWKDSLPDMPEINFDINTSEVFDEIKGLPPSIIRRLFENEEIKTQILPILFPSGETLNRLKVFYQTQQLPIYQRLAQLTDMFLQFLHDGQKFLITFIFAFAPKFFR